MRHDLDHIMYESCDIRRNKRAQCKSNFEISSSIRSITIDIHV